MSPLLLFVVLFINHALAVTDANISSDGETFFHWRGTNKPSSAQKIGNINVNLAKGVLIEFDINAIHQLQLRNILHIGNADLERYPSIYQYDSSKIENYKYTIDIAGHQFNTPKFLTWDHIKIFFNSTWVYIEWNYGDTIIANQPITINQNGIESKTIYFSDPWEESGYKMRVRDLKIDVVDTPFTPSTTKIITTYTQNGDNGDTNSAFNILDGSRFTEGHSLVLKDPFTVLSITKDRLANPMFILDILY